MEEKIYDRQLNKESLAARLFLLVNLLAVIPMLSAYLLHPNYLLYPIPNNYVHLAHTIYYPCHM